MTESEIRTAINAKRASLHGSSFAADLEGFKELESLKVRFNTSRAPLFYAHKCEAASAKRRAKHV